MIRGQAYAGLVILSEAKDQPQYRTLECVESIRPVGHERAASNVLTSMGLIFRFAQDDKVGQIRGSDDPAN